MKRADQSGFTLVELAIVIAIVGLIAGGIFGGQAIIRGSKVNKVLVDANQYADAMYQFRAKYEYLPGDYPSAVSMWGSIGGSGADNFTGSCIASASPTAISGNASCNGNGDALIGGGSENFLVWQHLSLGGYIAGRYTGVSGAGFTYNSINGLNQPAGALDNTGYFVWSWGVMAVDDANFFAGDYNNVFTFGTKESGSWTSGGALSAQEAYTMDNKADDGMPSTGSIRMIYPSRAGCISAPPGGIAKYNQSSQGPMCTMVFMRSYRNQSQL